MNGGMFRTGGLHIRPSERIGIAVLLKSGEGFDEQHIMKLLAAGIGVLCGYIDQLLRDFFGFYDFIQSIDAKKKDDCCLFQKGVRKSRKHCRITGNDSDHELFRTRITGR